jgi:hypothetical protein
VSTPPPHPKIYHITHVDNLPAIIAGGGLVSDAAIIAQGGPAASIGITSIKANRLRLPVKCHQGDHVGESVPFNFCPRSVMLYILHRANNPSLTYYGGQEPIVHLEADLHSVIGWASANGRRWAFSPSNAGAFYTPFYADVNDLNQIDWNAVANPDFSNAQVKEAKQAEFLIKDSFPWELVEHVGVFSRQYELQVKQLLANVAHKPAVSVQRNWYF